MLLSVFQWMSFHLSLLLIVLLIWFMKQFFSDLFRDLLICFLVLYCMKSFFLAVGGWIIFLEEQEVRKISAKNI